MLSTRPDQNSYFGFATTENIFCYNTRIPKDSSSVSSSECSFSDASSWTGFRAIWCGMLLVDAFLLRFTDVGSIMVLRETVAG